MMEPRARNESAKAWTEETSSQASRTPVTNTQRDLNFFSAPLPPSLDK
jgi:hypothetical protein